MSENECTVDGVRYVAVETPSLCYGCVAYDNGNVPLCEALHECMPEKRKDRRRIVWQPTPSAPDELTALREMNRELVEGLEEIVSGVDEADELHESGVAIDWQIVVRAKALIAKARGEK